MAFGWDLPSSIPLPTGTAGVAAALVAARFYWRWRLSRWARSQGMTLVSFRGAASFEGPQKFLRSDNQGAFRVELRTRNGAPRFAWGTFGSFWGFVFGEPIADVQWDSDR